MFLRMLMIISGLGFIAIAILSSSYSKVTLFNLIWFSFGIYYLLSFKLLFKDMKKFTVDYLFQIILILMQLQILMQIPVHKEKWINKLTIFLIKSSEQHALLIVLVITILIVIRTIIELKVLSDLRKKRNIEVANKRKRLERELEAVNKLREMEKKKHS